MSGNLVKSGKIRTAVDRLDVARMFFVVKLSSIEGLCLRLHIKRLMTVEDKLLHSE